MRRRAAEKPPDALDEAAVTSPGFPRQEEETGGGTVSKARLQPFRFGGLEKVSRAEIALIQRLARLFPAAAGTWADALRARMKELFDEPVHLELDQVQVVGGSAVRQRVAEPTFLAVLAPASQKLKVFLEIELGLAHAVVDKLLGGEGESVSQRALTDIEEGVVGFIVLEALRTLAPNLDPGLPQVRLESVSRGLGPSAGQLADDAQWVCLSFKGALGDQAGFVRVFLPTSVLKMVAPSVAGPERRARRRAEIQRHLRRLSAVKAQLRVEIGWVEIASKDAAGLREGDVVVFDELWTRADRGQAGRARLWTGPGQGAHAEAELTVESGRYRAKLIAFLPGPAARRAAAENDKGQLPRAGSAKPEDEPTHVVAAPIEREKKNVSEDADEVDLLNDIPLQLAVELGRVQVTAEEVATLAVGHIIDLGRAPGEPVELSVHGKIVARGELVEIEGHLGVRIVSLLG